MGGVRKGLGSCLDVCICRRRTRERLACIPRHLEIGEDMSQQEHDRSGILLSDELSTGSLRRGGCVGIGSSGCQRGRLAPF